MGDSWGPVNLDLIFAEEGILGMVQNPFIVQFIHRWIPFILLIIMGWILYRSERSDFTNPLQKSWIRTLTVMFLLQFLLGIHGVPVFLGVVHQFGAVILLGLNIITLFLFTEKNIFDKKTSGA